MRPKLNFSAILILLSSLIFSSCGAGGNSNGNGTAATYTVFYDGNGHSSGSVPVDAANYEQGTTVTVLDNTGNLARDHYLFSGWCLNTNGTGTSYTQGQTLPMGSVNITLYAKWTQNPTYTATYDGNGHSSGSVPVDATNYEQGNTVTVLGAGTLAKAGHTFTCWNTQADGNGTDKVPSSTFAMGAGNVILYAKWAYPSVFIQPGEGFVVSIPGITAPDGGWIKKLAWDLNNDGSSDITWNRIDTNGDGVTDGSDAGPNFTLTLTWAQMGGIAGLQAVGQHPIFLTVTDSYDTSISYPAMLTIVNNALVARISVNPAEGTPTTLFTFDGSQSEHLFPGQSISSWQWDFDNNGIFEISGQTVDYTFNAAGTFTVTLRVRDLSGHQNTASIQVTTQ